MITESRYAQWLSEMKQLATNSRSPESGAALPRKRVPYQRVSFACLGTCPPNKSADTADAYSQDSLETTGTLRGTS